MKVFQNIEAMAEKSRPEFIPDLKRVVNDLIPLRRDRNKTEKYIDEHLLSDLRWMNSTDKKYFSYHEGEIPRLDAQRFRWDLLEVISYDQFSFGFAYWALGVTENQIAEQVLSPCVFAQEEIMYHIDFDLEEIRERVREMPSQERKYYLDKILLASQTNSYDGKKYVGEYRDLIEGYLKYEIADWEALVSPQTKSASNRKSHVAPNKYYHIY